MWRELIKSINPEATCRAPATAEMIAAAEQNLGVAFPEELVSLLRETNGILDEDGFSVVRSCERIVSENRTFRNGDLTALYMSFDQLLLFGAQSNGDEYAYCILAGRIRRDVDIFRWDHKSDSRCIWAVGLERYLTLALQPGHQEYPDVHGPL